MDEYDFKGTVLFQIVCVCFLVAFEQYLFLKCRLCGMTWAYIAWNEKDSIVVKGSMTYLNKDVCTENH